jgi:hypothetical protein
MIKVMGGKPKDNRSGKEKMKDGKAGNKSQQGAANLIDLVGGEYAKYLNGMIKAVWEKNIMIKGILIESKPLPARQ